MWESQECWVPTSFSGVVPCSEARSLVAHSLQLQHLQDPPWLSAEAASAAPAEAVTDVLRPGLFVQLCLLWSAPLCWLGLSNSRHRWNPLLPHLPPPTQPATASLICFILHPFFPELMKGQSLVLVTVVFLVRSSVLCKMPCTCGRVIFLKQEQSEETPWWSSGQDLALQCRGWRFDPWLGS